MSDPTMEEAIVWFACVHSDRRTRTDEDRFAQWLKQDKRHEEAYAHVEKVWRAAGPPITPRSMVASERKRWRGRQSVGWIAGAAAVAVASVVTAFIFSNHQAISRGSFATPTGSQQELKLSDGSLITLNTRSEVRVDIDKLQRIVHLARGEARFRVAKDSRRPFIVETGAARVRALGTAFDVRVSEERVAVTLVEGRVEVVSTGLARSAQKSIVLNPGQQFAVDVESGEQQVQAVNLERTDAWLHGQLIFDAVPLSEAVQEANRYLLKPVVIEDPSLAEIRVSGVVRAGSAGSFVGALEASFPIKAVERHSGPTLVRKID